MNFKECTKGFASEEFYTLKLKALNERKQVKNNSMQVSFSQ